ncbi:MAG: hypothetical protein DCC68_09585 [Planctomycetota bacterium]|nr:MAG: hypothetical protein DCC68_09585 [Planctomycetota bacterium]
MTYTAPSAASSNATGMYGRNSAKSGIHRWPCPERCAVFTHVTRIISRSRSMSRQRFARRPQAAVPSQREQQLPLGIRTRRQHGLRHFFGHEKLASLVPADAHVPQLAKWVFAHQLAPHGMAEELPSQAASPPNRVVGQRLIGPEPDAPRLGVAAVDFPQRFVRAEVLEQAPFGMPEDDRRAFLRVRPHRHVIVAELARRHHGPLGNQPDGRQLVVHPLIEFDRPAPIVPQRNRVRVDVNRNVRQQIPHGQHAAGRVANFGDHQSQSDWRAGNALLIEHRLFPHITRALQGMFLMSLDMVRDFVRRATTTTGWRVFARKLLGIYKTGQRAAATSVDHLRVRFESTLPRWN